MELNKKRMLAFFAFGIVLLVALSVVSAVENSSVNATDKTDKNRTARALDDKLPPLPPMPPLKEGKQTFKEGLKAKAWLNGTFGDCVSNMTKQENSCYAEMKLNRQNCEAAAKQNDTAQNKSTGFWTRWFGHKQCNAEYKADTNLCKQEFKNAKDECKALKNKQ